MKTANERAPLATSRRPTLATEGNHFTVTTETQPQSATMRNASFWAHDQLHLHSLNQYFPHFSTIYTPLQPGRLTSLRLHVEKTITC